MRPKEGRFTRRHGSIAASPTTATAAFSRSKRLPKLYASPFYEREYQVSDSIQALVVDDDPIARKTVRIALEREGFHCDVAVDGDDAARYLGNGRYALVVTDLRMPNKHGHALSLELLERNPRPMIVVHSGVDDPRLTKDLLLRGVDDIVYKPANYAAFAAKMKALVSRRESKSANGVPKKNAVNPRGRTNNGDVSEADADPLSEATSTVPAGTPVSLADIEAKLSLVMRVLPVSKAAFDVFEMTRTGCDAPALGAAIRRDAALAAEVLSIANSNFYNTTGKAVTELDKAVVRIGQRRTGELALAASTLSGMTKRQFAWLDMQTMWRQSIAAGVAVELLVAQGKHGTVGENLALIAIMHSLGRVVLGTLYPGHYRQLVHQCEEQGEALIEQEKQIFPENHAQIMSRLLSVWKIPKEICKPMNHILDPYTSLNQLAKPTRTKAELVKLAVFIGQLATRAWHPWDLVEIPPASLLDHLQIRDVASVLEQTRVNSQTIIDAQSKDSSIPGGRTGPKQVEGTGRKIHYAGAPTRSFDFLGQLIQDLGMTLVPYSPDSEPPVSNLLINGIDGDIEELRSELQIPDDVETLVVTDIGRPATVDGFSQSLQFPTNYGSLQAALLAM